MEYTEYCDEMHNRGTGDPSSTEYINCYSDGCITPYLYPMLNYKLHKKKIHEKNQCLCCERHQKNKVCESKLNKELYSEFEWSGRPLSEKDCSCDCRHYTRLYARLYTDAYNYFCEYIEEELSSEYEKQVMDYDVWLKTCLDFQDTHKPLYCSREAIDMFMEEKLLLEKFKKEVYYEHTTDGSVSHYVYYDSYLVRIEERVYMLEMCSEEINLDYWHEYRIQHNKTLDDNTVVSVNRLVLLNMK